MSDEGEDEKLTIILSDFSMENILDLLFFMSKKIQIMNLKGRGVLESDYKKIMNNFLSGKYENFGQF